MNSPTPFLFRRRALPLLFSLIGCAILVTSLLLLNQPKFAAANSDDLANAVTKYPGINGTRLDACALCHTSQVPALNPYGAAYKSNGRDGTAFGAIENLDSDGDGFSNLQEIQALSFPGNAADVPHATVQPSVTAAPTSQATPFPTPTVGAPLPVRLFLPMIVQ
ncbi:MAG: hypothetical protein PHQ40_15150 [Anaerolineaceae bacterium]|nr:hypothetical protein [Anaerolineaceae bacterium]